MRLLLDTHALLWWSAGDPQLSAAAREAIPDRRNEIWVSAASAWEIAAQQRLGKLPPLAADAKAFGHLRAAAGFELLPVSAAHAWQAGAMADANRDPFDRMLAAQSEIEQLVPVTRDPAFAAFQTHTLW